MVIDNTSLALIRNRIVACHDIAIYFYHLQKRIFEKRFYGDPGCILYRANLFNIYASWMFYIEGDIKQVPY